MRPLWRSRSKGILCKKMDRIADITDDIRMIGDMRGATHMIGRGNIDGIEVRVETGDIGGRKRNTCLVLGTAAPRCQCPFLRLRLCTHREEGTARLLHKDQFHRRDKHNTHRRAGRNIGLKPKFLLHRQTPRKAKQRL
jgi:hypothetical protein